MPPLSDPSPSGLPNVNFWLTKRLMSMMAAKAQNPIFKPYVSIIDPATTLTAPSGLPADSGLAVFSRMVDAQAVMLATNDFYAMATILILVFAGVVWLAKRPKGPLKQVSH